jgi:hypothetical protein
MLTDFSFDLDESCNNTLNIFNKNHNMLENNNNNLFTIYNYLNTFIDNNKYFDLNKSFLCILKKIENLLHVQFIKVDDLNENIVWDLDSCYHYKIYDNSDILLGTINFQLHNNNFIKNKCISICTNTYTSSTLFNNHKIPTFAFLANYDNLISYNDIVNIFYQFGYIIHIISKKYKYSILNSNTLNNIEYINLSSIILTLCAKDKNTIQFFTKHAYISNSSNIKNLDIEKVYFILNSIRLKIKCIIALFDLMFHINTNMLDFVKNTNSNNIHNVISNIYLEIYNKNIKRLHIPQQRSLDPYYITQLKFYIQTNIFGIIYTEILNEITAFNIFYNIKHNKMGNVYTKLIFSNNSIPDNIKSFLKINNSQDLYKFYLQHMSPIQLQLNK